MTDEPPVPAPEDDPLGARLTALRPTPRAGYRGTLRRALIALGPPSARPAHLHRLVAGYAVVGLVLLAVGVASIAGWGPLAS